MIEVKNVSKYFSKPFREPGFKGAIKTIFTHKSVVKKAVDDISFTIKDGEIVGYIGSNGAGKSTTIKMMTGILTPTKGEILFDGKKPYNSKDRKGLLKDIGVVFGQRTQLWWDLPLRDSFDLYRDIYDIPKKEYDERLKYLSDLLNLEPIMLSQLRNLSLGQRMRADLAAALIHNPKILFLDEPTIGLDVLVKDKITEAILKINKEFNTTIILTTHDMKDIQKLCNRVIIIDEGHLLYDGSINDIKRKIGDLRHIFILTSSKVDIEKVKEDFANDINIEFKDTGYYEFTYDADHIKAQKIFSYLTEKFEIQDLKVGGTSLETIVKTIYANKSI